MPTKEIMDLLESAEDEIDEIKAHSARSGKHLQAIGKWLVPQTKHYSWLKAADIIGIGLIKLSQYQLTITTVWISTN